LVQTEDFAKSDELFDSEYAYFSSFSASWLSHSKRYCEAMTARFSLSSASHVVEVAANDGYLLQYFKAAGIPCLGIEPTESTAKAAREKGIEIIQSFFGETLGENLMNEGRGADLTAANNVLAHVPDINDFVKGFARILKPDGVSTFEFPSLLNLRDLVQFDTIYHEHFSYLSLTAVNQIFDANGLSVFEVEELPTHGGSLRVFAQRRDTGKREKSAAVEVMLERERTAGLSSREGYAGFQRRTDDAKDALLSFLITARGDCKKVVAYGAAAKGNTFLNYAGVRPDLVSAVVDLNPAKQGKFMPGSRIPIAGEEIIRDEKPDYILILPWNLSDEIVGQLAYAREWGANFVISIPKLRVF
jgi:SAM-dependent methyltransferase